MTFCFLMALVKEKKKKNTGTAVERGVFHDFRIKHILLYTPHTIRYIHLRSITPRRATRNRSSIVVTFETDSILSLSRPLVSYLPVPLYHLGVTPLPRVFVVDDVRDRSTVLLGRDTVILRYRSRDDNDEKLAGRTLKSSLFTLLVRVSVRYTYSILT